MGSRSMQPLTFALGNYGLTKPIKRAGTDFGQLDLKFVEVDQIVPMMRRMCRGLEFDICEMAFTTYVCARAAGLPFTAIPVFVTRNFHHWAIVQQHQIRHPDAEGPGGPQGRRQPRLHRHHRAVGARHPAERIRRRPEQGHLDSDRRRARRWEFTAPERGLQPPRQTDAGPLLSGEIDAALGEVGIEHPRSSRSFPMRATPRSTISAAPASIRSTTASSSRTPCSRTIPGSPAS